MVCLPVGSNCSRLDRLVVAALAAIAAAVIAAAVAVAVAVPVAAELDMLCTSYFVRLVFVVAVAPTAVRSILDHYFDCRQIVAVTWKIAIENIHFVRSEFYFKKCRYSHIT